jgi:hypothetical protein
MDENQRKAFQAKVKRDASPKAHKSLKLPGIGGDVLIDPDEKPIEITDDDWMRDGRDTSQGSQKTDDSE